ncbi:MAG TPA: LLM class flavin-dependent oxidoreductase [Actinomycetota bacterium]|jgi:F420-dependent oxidoreductase-like protein|nr:LLM class flavin-dependent oxidoreductase [Actinomycetota bacterium]
MRVCLMIEGQENVTWEQWKALAAACERSGIETLFRSDHYLSLQDDGKRGSLDAWTTIAALAAVTSKLHLGTLVSPVTFRHPSLLAKAVVTADHVSGGGRIELGLGAGWMEEEHVAYGFDFPPSNYRMQMLSEQLELVRKEWNESAFTQEGQHYSVRNLDALPKPIKQPRLLLGGGGGRRSLALAARHADEYNVVHMSEEQLRKVRAGMDDACKREGRDPASLPLSLMDPVDKAPTEQVVARFRQLESAGVTRVMLQHLQHEDLDTVEWIGKELAPALA